MVPHNDHEFPPRTPMGPAPLPLEALALEWHAQPAEDRLAWILGNPRTTEWYERAPFDILGTLADFRPLPTIWGQICEQFRAHGGHAVRLEKAVDALRGSTAPSALAAATPPLRTRALSTVAREDLSWLWYPYLLANKINLLEGDPDQGKTYVALAVASAVTQGFTLPDQHGHVGTPDPARAAHVLYITAEDGLGDTIRPRAEQLGADMDRLFIVDLDDLFPQGTPAFTLAHLAALEGAIHERDARLVILDPLQAFLGVKVDINATHQVRPLMTNLLAMLGRCQCACLALRHWNKTTGGKALYRGQASIDFAAAARSVLVVGRSPENRAHRILAQSKHNLAPDAASIVFALTDLGLEWCGTSDISADELSVAQPHRQRSKPRQEAMEWLQRELSHGPQSATMLTSAAAALGITSDVLRRARERLGVVTEKHGPVWSWRLPTIHQWERYPGMEPEEGMPF